MDPHAQRALVGGAFFLAIAWGIIWFFQLGPYSAGAGSHRATVTTEVPAVKAGTQGLKIVDGPKQRGDAQAFCFSKYPHWPQVIEKFEKKGKKCNLVAEHRATETRCDLNC
jgi:hypothetical protein